MCQPPCHLADRLGGAGEQIGARSHPRRRHRPHSLGRSGGRCRGPRWRDPRHRQLSGRGAPDRLHRARRAARRDRQPGPFPRARARAQGGPRKRQPRGGARRRHRRVRDAQHLAQHRQRRARRRQARPRPPPDVVRPRLLRRRDRRERRKPRRAGAHSRHRRRQDLHGRLDRQPARRRGFERWRGCWRAGGAASPSMPRTRRGCSARKDLRVEGDPSSPSGLARRRERDPRDPAHPAAGPRRPGGPIHILHVTTPAELELLAQPQRHRQLRGDAPAPDPRRRGRLSAARHLSRR